MSDIAVLQEVLGVSFNHLSLLEQSVVHSSYINENPGFIAGSNERLEFLGDAVLSFIIAERLYQEYPDFTEGEMTKARSGIVCRDTLARIAGSVGLGDYFYLGKGEEASGGRNKPANLEGAMEAVIAAIFLDSGLDITRDFVVKYFRKEIQKAINQGVDSDYKSRLQEILQSNRQLAPTYRLIEAVGPDHAKIFTVEVLAGDEVLGKGSGGSKKMAENEAARSALEQFFANFTR